jgi:hypothetical protein
MNAPLQNKCPIVTAIYMGESDTYSEDSSLIMLMDISAMLLYGEKKKNSQ